jgi:hypothetical protein
MKKLPLKDKILMCIMTISFIATLFLGIFGEIFFGLSKENGLHFLTGTICIISFFLVINQIIKRYEKI